MENRLYSECHFWSSTSTRVICSLYDCTLTERSNTVPHQPKHSKDLKRVFVVVSHEMMHVPPQEQQQPHAMIERSEIPIFSMTIREKLNHIPTTCEPPQSRLLPRRRRVRYCSVSHYPFFTTSITARIWMMLLWLLLVGSVPSINAQHYQAPPPPSSCDNPPSKSPNYAWEAWNSYEILGLEDPSSSSFSLSASALQKRQEHRTTLTHKDIRKAYRKQAQQWHPDKINNNNNNVNNSTSTTAGTATMISMEESNARFAKINEAQTVLSNPEAKLEYDNYLRYCEASHQQQTSSLKQRRYHDYTDWASSFFSQFSTPRNPFDVFFGSGGGGGPTTYNNDDDYAQYDSYFYGNQQQQQSPPPQQQQRQHSYGRPVRVYESQDIVYHATVGREVVRVTHTEEYAAENDGRFYYCVMAQDFVQVYDPYRGGFVLQPVTPQPYLLDEGWKSRPSQGRTKFTPPPPPPRQQQQQQQQQYSPKHEHYAFQSSHSISVGDVLTPNSPLLTSPNGRYYAGLSPDCQLLIFSDKSPSGKNKRQKQQSRNGSDDREDDKDDELIWSSPPMSPQLQQQQRQQRTQGQCFVMLRDNHLIVALGTPERPSHLLWYSDPDPRGPQSRQHGDNTKKYTSSQDSLDPIYMAQLDNDGSLAVYRIETVPQVVSHEYFYTNNDNNSKTPWTHFVSAALFGYPPRTKAAKAWVATRQWVASLVLAREYSGQFVRHKTCIHATGPMGCFRSARRLHQFARDGTFHVHRIVTKLDHALDQIITFLVQDEDDSEDDDEESIYHKVFSRSSNSNNNDENDKEDLLDRVVRKFYELKEETTLWARQSVRVVREKFLDRLQAAGFP
jgi:curved DNA-binding protein CbpA